MMITTTAFTELGWKKEMNGNKYEQITVKFRIFRPERKFTEQENAKPR